MRTVRDDSGKRYLLLAESDESSRVRDPETGEERFLPNERLVPVDDASPLETAAAGVPAPVRTALTASRDDRSLGLLVEIVDRGPRPVRSLLDACELCESDLHGRLAEFQVAGLVRETAVGHERGYEATDDAIEAVELLRDGE